MDRNDNRSERLEMQKELAAKGERPAPSLGISRRIFLHKSVLAGVGGAAAAGWLPFLNTIEVAQAAQTSFRFAWISDTHMYPREVNTRFVEKTVRAFKEVQAMNPPADFLIIGGDIGQLGDPLELELGAELLKEVKTKKVYIPGEHDWYLDMGKAWERMFGAPYWSFDHKGVRFIGLDTISHAKDFWTIRKMTPQERMGHMATLDGTLGGAWAAVGPEQLAGLDRTMSSWPKDKPVVIFSHNPLFDYYAPWNFWVRDWREVNEILRRHDNVTSVHGHVHQVLYNEIGKMRSIGMLATSWPWPYAPKGVPKLTTCMVRVDPGDYFDGVGWSALGMNSASKVDNEYVMWRKDIYATATADSGCGDNHNQVLHPRLADADTPPIVEASHRRAPTTEQPRCQRPDRSGLRGPLRSLCSSSSPRRRGPTRTSTPRSNSRCSRRSSSSRCESAICSSTETPRPRPRWACNCRGRGCPARCAIPLRPTSTRTSSPSSRSRSASFRRCGT